jgi:hypothetical protein
MGSQKGVEQLEGTTEHRQRRTTDNSKIGHICISSVGPLRLAVAGSDLKGTPQLAGNHTNSLIKSK